MLFKFNKSSKYVICFILSHGIKKQFKLNLGLIDKCQYELKVLKSLETILHADLHDQLAKTVNATKRGVANPIICSSCKQKIIIEPVYVFRYVCYNIV